MREDHVTNTVQDAAAYEQLRGRDEWIDDRPTRAELEADDADDHAWWLEQEARPDPWVHLPAMPPRVHAAIPTLPPF